MNLHKFFPYTDVPGCSYTFLYMYNIISNRLYLEVVDVSGKRKKHSKGCMYKLKQILSKFTYTDAKMYYLQTRSPRVIHAHI